MEIQDGERVVGFNNEWLFKKALQVWVGQKVSGNHMAAE